MVTYTDNKKLNKPANGEYPDTWDVPVNQDWDIIDKALGSAVTFTVGASDITLSISDAQNQRIVLTGTPGTSRYILLPFKYLSSTEAVGGMWIVDNQTNAAQYVITEVAGSAGVTVASGRKALVYSDGTDVKFADEVRLIAGNGISVSGSTVALSAPVTVANGGTGLSTLTAGNVILGNGTSTPSFVAPGTAGNVLTSNGSTWVSAVNSGGGGGGGITSINFFTESGSGLTFTPSSLSTPGGSVTLGGTLAMAKGGTGVTTIASGLVKSNGAILSGGNTVALGSDVSGTLPIGNGGTGTTSITSGFVKSTGSTLTGGNAVQLNTSDVTGQLGISNGGTGVSSFGAGFVKSNGSALSGANTVNLASSGDVGSSVLPIANGGTGASNATTALSNLGGVGSASPTFTGTANFAAISASGNITTSGGTITSSGTVTGSSFSFPSSAGTMSLAGSTYNVTIGGTNAFGCSTTNFAIPVNATIGSNLTITSNIQVNGTPFCATQSTFTVTSDARTKKDEAPYTKSISDVLSLQPKSYKYNGEYGTRDDGVTRVGLIAQDLLSTQFASMLGTHEYIDPVTGQKTEIYNVNSSELIFALVNTVKDLDARVKALEAKVGP